MSNANANIMKNFMDFCNFFNNTEQQIVAFADADAYKNYYDAYSSFLVAKKYNLDDIKTYRMNSLIDYFTEQYNIDKNYRDDLRKYYLEYVEDDFNKTLNPPRYPFYEAERLHREEMLKKQFEEETDEVTQHYKDLESKYKYFADLVHRINHPDEYRPHEDECYEYCENSSTSSEPSDYYEDTYDEYDCDDTYYDNYDQDNYMSDDDYYY